jgi:hypothetical protein
MPRKPPSVAKRAARPRGPAIYRLGEDPGRGSKLFMEPPLAFDSPTTSNAEWLIYCAMWLVTRSPGDPRKPPYIGYPPNFTYQQSIDGGRMFLGGQVVDFIYKERIGVNTQTGYWHMQQGSDIYYQEIAERARTAGLEAVIHLYDIHYIEDSTGKAACAVTALALKKIQLPDPWRTGTFRPTYQGVL